MFFIVYPRRYRRQVFCWTAAIAMGVFIGLPLHNAWTTGDLSRVALLGPAMVLLGALVIFPRIPMLILSVGIAGGLFGYEYYLKVRESVALRPIAQAAAAAVRPSAQAGIVSPVVDGPSVPGKILIWDVTKDRLSDAHYKLPAAVRATPQDQAMTLFLIWNIESRQVSTYYEIGAASQHGPGAGWGAYRDTALFAVVTWPGSRLVGWHAVVGEAPPKTISLNGGQPNTSDQHGDLIKPIVQWVRFLPGVPASPPPVPVSLMALEPASGASPGGATALPPPATLVSSAPASLLAPVWTEATAQKEAMRRYPQLAVPNSPLNRAYVARYQQIKAKDPAYLRDPSWPLRLADEVAKQGVKR